MPILNLIHKLQHVINAHLLVQPLQRILPQLHRHHHLRLVPLLRNGIHHSQHRQQLGFDSIGFEQFVLPQLQEGQGLGLAVFVVAALRGAGEEFELIGGELGAVAAARGDGR